MGNFPNVIRARKWLESLTHPREERRRLLRELARKIRLDKPEAGYMHDRGQGITIKVYDAQARLDSELSSWHRRRKLAKSIEIQEKRLRERRPYIPDRQYKQEKEQFLANWDRVQKQLRVL